MTTDIYDQHKHAFPNVSAYVIAHKGERVATIAFKYPRDGAGRLYAYVHWLGTEMVRGYAGGGGYDKHSAACRAAAKHMTRVATAQSYLGWSEFKAALMNDDGYYWNQHLERAGFQVWQAV